MKRKHPDAASYEAVRGKVKASKGFAGISLLIYLFDKLSDVIYNALINGFFGYIFTAYTSELTAYERGYVVSYFRGGSKTRRIFRKIREYLSKSFETSFILKRLRRWVCGFAYLTLRTYGSYLLSFGIYTLLVYFIKVLLPVMGTADIKNLLVGICICIVALPLYASRMTLAKAVKHGRITGALFVHGFGYRDEAFENKTNAKKSKRSGLPILLGLLTGILTFVLDPLDIIVFLLVCITVTLIIGTPEIGILLCLFGLPFFSFADNPTMLLATLVLVSFFSYFIKLVRGKRIFKLELLDFIVLVFLLFVMFSGYITVGGRVSYNSACISCILMLGYFLVVNLIRTEKWLHRCILALVSSGTIVAFVGIVEYMLGLSSNDWLDISYFHDILGRTTSLFENPNYLAAYLTVIFPFALYQMIMCRTKKESLLGFISCISIVLCNIFTWSRAAWIAMIICTLIFFMIFSRKTMRLIFGIIVAVPFLSFILPENIVNRFMSIGDMADSSTLYRVYTWKGSLRMVEDYFWGGIGYGTEAFVQLYPVYAYAGIEASPHSHSLYLQILIGMGIGALICFALIALFYVQKCFEYIKLPMSKDSMLITAAALVATVGMLIMGLFDYVWYNYRIFFLFWIVLAIGTACVRIGHKEMARNRTYGDIDEYSATLDIDVN